MIEIKEVTAEQTYEIRRATLRKGLKTESVTNADDKRQEAFHLLALSHGKAVGAVSCAPGPVRQGAIFEGRDGWRLYQMGVASPMQSTGVGRKLVEAVIERVRARGGSLVWAMARDSASGFYERCGFVISGPQYLGWAGIPHHTAVRVLREEA